MAATLSACSVANVYDKIQYNVPSEEVWRNADDNVGYASFYVEDGVDTFEGWGFGIYIYHRDAEIRMETAMEVPDKEGVKVHNICTVYLSGHPGLKHIINDKGDALETVSQQAFICEYSAGNIKQNPPYWVWSSIAGAVIILLIAFAVWLRLFIRGRKQTLSKKKYKVIKKKFTVTYNGKTIVGKLLIPKTERKIPLVICSHGFGANYKTTEVLVGDTLSRSGIACLCFDFYGGNRHSKSGGSMLEMTPLTEKEDLFAVFERAANLDFVDWSNVFLFGESQGGLVTALAANEVQERIAGVILYYPAFAIPEIAQKLYAEWDDRRCWQIFGKKISEHYLTDSMQIDIYREIETFSKPVLIVHGDADTRIDISYGERASKIYPNAKFVVLHKQYHGFSGRGKMKAVRYVYDFIENCRSEENV